MHKEIGYSLSIYSSYATSLIENEAVLRGDGTFKRRELVEYYCVTGTITYLAEINAHFKEMDCLVRLD